MEPIPSVRNPSNTRARSLSFRIAPGEICMIVGSSDCGKTTLLNAIAGFHSIDSGSIRLDGELLCGPGQTRRLSRPRPEAIFLGHRVVVMTPETIEAVHDEAMKAFAAGEKEGQ